MEEITKLFDNIVNKSAKEYSSSRVMPTTGRWKYCVALVKLGWNAYDFEPIMSRTEDEVIIKWRKEGKEDIHLKLGWTDQCLWIAYMEKNHKEQLNEGTDKDTAG